MSLTKKIIGSFLLVSIVPITIFGIFIVEQVFNITQRSAFERNISIAQQISWQLDTYFDTIQKFLESLASLSEIRHFDKEKVDKLLESYYSSYTIYYGRRTVFEANPFESFTILNAQGKVRTVYPSSDEGLDLSYSDQPFFKEVLKTNQIYFSSDILISEISGEPIVQIAVPVFDEAGDISSIIETDIRLESIIQLTSQTKEGETGYVFVINEQGDIIVHPDKDFILQQKNIEELSPGLLSLLAPKSTFGKSFIYPEEKPNTVIAYFFPRTIEWTVILSQSLSEVLSFPLSIRNQFILVLFSTIAFVGFISFYLSQGITSSLRKLTKKVVEIGIKQDLGAEIDIKTGDEIQELAASFNQMLRSLKTKTVELEEKTEEVQKKKADLDKLYRLTVGRELRMIELKQEIKKLEEKLEKEKESKRNL